jgi:hypothetical protein
MLLGYRIRGWESSVSSLRMFDSAVQWLLLQQAFVSLVVCFVIGSIHRLLFPFQWKNFAPVTLSNPPGSSVLDQRQVLWGLWRWLDRRYSCYRFGHRCRRRACFPIAGYVRMWQRRALPAWNLHYLENAVATEPCGAPEPTAEVLQSEQLPEGLWGTACSMLVTAPRVCLARG